MGSIISAIHDDIDQYEFLCEYYKERPEYSHGSPDCYGEHAKKLKNMFELERKIKQSLKKNDA